MSDAQWPCWHSLEGWLADAARVHAAEAPAVAAAATGGALHGRCRLCDHDTLFHDSRSHDSRSQDSRSGNLDARLREGLLCAHCHCNARQRAAAMVLLDALPVPARARVYTTEQASVFYLALRRRVGRVIGSEFDLSRWQRLWLSAWLWRHGAMAMPRVEDITALRMDGASLDAAVSLDVLEHVPDCASALREFARIIKPGGVLVMTVPFHDGQAENVRIAKVDPSGAVEHFGVPEFHGDPLSGGVACFHHFGWALVDALHAAGFADATACRVQDAACGLPQGQWVLRAMR